MSLSFVCPDLHKSECDSLKCLLSLLKLMHINFSFTSECGVDFPQDSEWAGHGLGLQVNTNEWREQLEAIQALANSKLGIACYSCTVAFSHNLPLCCSSALSLPLAYTHSHNSLCLSLFRPRSRPHSLFTSLTLSLWLCFYQNVKSFLVNFQNVTDIKGDFCVLYLLGTYAEAHLQISHRFLSKMFTSKEET